MHKRNVFILNDAADEMEARLVLPVSSLVDLVAIKTYHVVGIAIETYDVVLASR
jgi:hypothetical protein